jgi:hypothetical protein
VLHFCQQILFEIFFAPLRSKWAKKLIEVKDPLLVSDFNQNWNMPLDISKTSGCQVQLKLFSRYGIVVCGESRCHGEADRYDFVTLLVNARKRVGWGKRRAKKLKIVWKVCIMVYVTVYKSICLGVLRKTTRNSQGNL